MRRSIRTFETQIPNMSGRTYYTARVVTYTTTNDTRNMLEKVY